MARLRKQILRLDQRWLIARVIMRSAIGFFASFTVSSGVLAANVLADPADDALAKLNELSRQAEQTTEALHSAQLDLNESSLPSGPPTRSLRTTERPWMLREHAWRLFRRR